MMCYFCCCCCCCCLVSWILLLYLACGVSVTLLNRSTWIRYFYVKHCFLPVAGSKQGSGYSMVVVPFSVQDLVVVAGLQTISKATNKATTAEQWEAASSGSNAKDAPRKLLPPSLMCLLPSQFQILLQDKNLQ